MTQGDFVVLLVAIGVLLALARLLGEVLRRFNLPSVLGEIIAGILLGPTVLGMLAPGLQAQLFPAAGPVHVTLTALAELAVVLFLFVAGMEVDLSTMWERGRTTFFISVLSMAAPFALGFGLAWQAPVLFGTDSGGDRLFLAVFIGTCMAISALPVIARTLMDLNLFHTDFGMVIIAVAIFNDLCGWLIFAGILAVIGEGHGFPIRVTIPLTLAYAALMLTAGRWLMHRCLPWFQAHTAWPGGILSIGLILALLNGAFTEWIGVHAIFGAFLFGVAIGDSPHLRQHTRNIIREFISSIFAPLFFATIGLKVNFALHFDFTLVTALFACACVGKILGCSLAARVTGMTARESWGLGFALNSRGAMEIVLGLLGLQYGIINERIFVALVVVALGTSIISGPLMQLALKLKKPKRIGRYLNSRTYVGNLAAGESMGAIRQLSQAAAAAYALDPEEVFKAVWAREKILATGIGDGVAIPHARMKDLDAPVVAVGISPDGIDFDARDGEPARLIFLILTPLRDEGAQLEILADISRTFHNPDAREHALNARNYTEFLALLNVGDNA